MKLTHTVIDERCNLIGFVVEGRANEFGMLGDDIIPRSIQSQELISSGFDNSQIRCVNGRIVEKGEFKLNSLPMQMFKNNQFVSVASSIELLSRILVDGELKGFKVRLKEDTEIAFTYRDVITLSTWFKPKNFVIRSVNSKLFIAGKPGVTKLEDLPEENRGNKVETGKKKRTRGTGTNVNETKETKVPTRADLITLYDIVRDCDGLVIKLPDEDYKSTNTPKEKVGSEFNSLGIGEIASAYLDYGETKLNANTRFKKPGTVILQQYGAPWPVYTYTWSTKHIFYNGKSHMNRVGVAVTPESAAKIKEIFSTNLITREIADKQTLEPIKALTGKGDYLFFEVDTTKLGIMSEEMAKSSILPNSQLHKLAANLGSIKLQQKILKQGLKSMAEMAPEAAFESKGELFPIYRGMNEEMLDRIEAAGIDIFTGAFSKREKSEESGKSGKASVGGTVDFEIEYAVKVKTDKNLSYTTVANGTAENVDENLAKAVTMLESISNPMEQYLSTKKYLDELDKAAYTVKKQLWMHKIAMFILGDGHMHTHNTASWKEVPTRKKNTKDYACIDPDCTDLIMRLTGLSI